MLKMPMEFMCRFRLKERERAEQKKKLHNMY